jgi:crossover junction endodeoxyribonuclease RusA
MSVDLRLPWPPSVNTYWRHIAIHGRPRTLISKAGREYRQAVCREVVAAHAVKQYDCELYVSIIAYPPDRRARDVDNLLKAVLDGMQAAGVYLNDTQICTLSITKSRTIHPGGLLFVGVQPAEAANWRDALKEDAA